MKIKTDPLVTIYIVSKNHRKYLLKSIKSVLSQSYKNLEIFFVDDNSKDKSFELAKKSFTKKKIKFVKFKKNTGLQSIANFVLKHSNGKYFLRLDADDWLDENAILNLVYKIESSNKIGAVFGSYYYTNEKGEIIGEEKNLKYIEQNFGPPHGACTLFRTRSLKEVGGYSREFKAQDGWEVWLKLKDRMKFANVQTSVFYYRQLDKSVSRKINIITERSKIIKKISKKLSGGYNQKTLAVIPVKNMFPGIKNVALKKKKRKSLLDLSIKDAINSNVFEKIIITSADKKVGEYIKKNYSKLYIDKKVIFIKRPKKFDKSISSLQEILKFVSNRYKHLNKYDPDIICVLSLHVIRNNIGHIKQCINLLMLDKYDIVFSAFKEKDPVFKFKKKKIELLNQGRFQSLDFNNEKIFKFNGSVIALWNETLKIKNMFLSNAGILENQENELEPIYNLSKYFN